MFARDGYTPLSRLWEQFEGKYLPLCKERALACMEADPHSSDFVFGTALDLCEDVFLMSFDKSVLDLVPLVGEVVQLDPALTRSGARFLLKTTVSVGLTPHPASFVDVRFRPFIDLKGVSLWKLGTSFSQGYRAVQMASGAGLWS